MVYKSNIFSNKITHTLTYDATAEDYKIDGENISIKNFYKNFIYEFNIGDTSLLDYLFIITDTDNQNYYKNIMQSGEMGHPHLFIRIYIDPSETLEYKIKYKKIKTDENYTILPLYKIINPPFYFYPTQTDLTLQKVIIHYIHTNIGGNGDYHSHNLGTPQVTYYMPNGLNQDPNAGPITQWHGNFISTTTGSTTTGSTTNPTYPHKPVEEEVTNKFRYEI